MQREPFPLANLLDDLTVYRKTLKQIEQHRAEGRYRGIERTKAEQDKHYAALVNWALERGIIERE